MVTLGVLSVQIGVKRSISIRQSPLLIDGITPKPMQTTHSLSALVWIQVKEANTLFGILSESEIPLMLSGCLRDVLRNIKNIY